MVTLVLHTVDARAEVALFEEGQELAHVSQTSTTKRPSEVVFGLVTACLAQAQKNAQDIAEVVINIGPGSFTGIRLGLSFAAGLQLSAPIKVKGVSAFEALQEDPAAEDADLVLRAGRRDIFHASRPFGRDKIAQISEDKLEILQGKMLVAGSEDIQKQLEETGVKAAIPRNTTVVNLLLASKKRASESGIPAPLYIRLPEVN